MHQVSVMWTAKRLFLGGNHSKHDVHGVLVESDKDSCVVRCSFSIPFLSKQNFLLMLLSSKLYGYCIT